MPVSINNTTLTFNDGTTMTTAATGGVTSLNGQTGAITNTSFEAIGSYITSVNSANIPPSTTQTFNAGDTVAGSNIRYNWIGSGFSGGGRTNPPGSGNVTAVWNSGGSTSTGTWRFMQRTSNTNGYDSENNNINATWIPTLFVRIS